VANVVQILVQGQDQFSGTAQKVRTEARGLGGAMGGLKTTMIGVAGGFIAAQASMAGVSNLMSKTVGAAMAYEHQLAVIRALTGATKADTTLLDKSIKDLTKTLPKSPAELGAGAYFILSSGIKDVNTATKVLALSAKASVIGLGETKTVASVLTSVMNAYQLKATDAAKATDTLVNIVKLGKGEPEEFAQALGFVIPIAAQMGVEFEQVGAVLATMTNTGLGAAEAVTALRGVLSQILSPSDEARKTFAALGFDVEAFRKEVDTNFVGAMARLSASVGSNEEAWAGLFPEVRGMIGAMSAFGNQLPQTEQNLADITAGAGALDKGFKEVADTTQFRTQKATNDFNVALMQLGGAGLPIVTVGLKGLTLGARGLAEGVTATSAGVRFLSVVMRDNRVIALAATGAIALMLGPLNLVAATASWAGVNFKTLSSIFNRVVKPAFWGVANSVLAVVHAVERLINALSRIKFPKIPDLTPSWLPGFQHGGIVRSPLQLVGERGPELAALPMGSRVFSNAESRQMLASAAPGGGGQSLVLNFTFTGPVLGDQHQANELVQWLLPALRGALR